VGFLIGAIILFHFIIILAQKVLGPLGKNAAVLSEEALRARDVALYGQSGKGDLDDTVVDVDEQVWVCCCCFISFWVHFVPYSLGCGASCDSSDILA